MQRILLFAVAVAAFGRDSWSSGLIKVLDTDAWCSRPGIADWPGICGPPKASSTTLLNDAGNTHPASPYSQILQIDGPDATYVVRRTSLDGGLSFQAGARAQFALDGKHLLIKFDRVSVDRHGDTKVQHDHDRTDILEVRKK